MSIPLTPYDDKRRKIMLVVLSVSLSSLLGWSIYNYESKGELLKRIDQLQQSNLTLSERKIKLEIQQQALFSDIVDQQQAMALHQATANELQTELTALQNQVIGLNKELDFYKNITNGNTTSDLHVRAFILDEAPDDDLKYHYRLVLSQGKKISKSLSGKVNIKLTGKKQNEKVTIHIDDHKLNLRHVQVLQGRLNYNDAFKPEKIHVTITQKKKTTLNTTMDWNTIINPPQNR
ncbi:MAG TPA: hypothetical protein DCS49_04255 [Gammaproteobacteria bacterium]|nr:hypothetical protein [Gammaproteobacteria bacterium]